MGELPRPSELVARMSSGLFLPCALRRSEIEQAAAVLIHICAVEGDEWKHVSPPTVGRFIRARKDDNDWRILRNPGFRPDFPALISAGFGDVHETFGSDGKCETTKVMLTPDAITRCAKSLGLKTADES